MSGTAKPTHFDCLLLAAEALCVLRVSLARSVHDRERYNATAQADEKAVRGFMATVARYRQEWVRVHPELIPLVDPSIRAFETAARALACWWPPPGRDVTEEAATEFDGLRAHLVRALSDLKAHNEYLTACPAPTGSGADWSDYCGVAAWKAVLRLTRAQIGPHLRALAAQGKAESKGRQSWRVALSILDPHQRKRYDQESAA